MCNYSLFKGNLKLKIVVTGNPFLFGRMQVSYMPLESWGINDRYTDGSGFGAKMIRSQRQIVNIDPSTSTGGEFTLPFIWNQDYIPVPDIISVGLIKGMLHFDILDRLRNVSDNTNQSLVNIAIYAWLDNVELAGLTANNIELMQAQSGQEQQSANDGKVSVPLAKVGNALNAMSKVPGLGGMATAGFVASTASEIAKLFGYSRPMNQNEPQPIAPRAASSISHAVGTDNSLKLTLNPSQCVSVDPDIVGSDRDDMAFANIVTIPSLLDIQPWSKSALTGTSLFSAAVSPGYKYIDDTDYYMPAVTGAMLPFAFWNGTMVFRFDVISTSFHRGRLLLVYDPGPAKNNAQQEENVQYCAVIDLADSRSFQAEISYNSAYGVLRNYPPLTSTPYDEVPKTTIAPASDNGTLTLYVLNELTSSSTTVGAPTDVSILVYVSGGNDLNGFSPRSVPIEWVPNSGDEPVNVGKGRDDIPSADLRVKFRTTDAVSSVYIGEVCPSIRYLLKRYCLYTTVNGATDYEHITIFSHGLYPFPSLTNPVTDATHYLHRTSSDEGINYVTMTYLAYYRPAFVTLRGGTRWKLVPSHGDVGVVNRVLETEALSYIGVSPDYLSDSQSKYAATTMGRYRNVCNGGTVASSSVNSVLEFEVPFHSQIKFFTGRTVFGCASGYGYELSGFLANIKPGGLITVFTAAAEDLTLGTFIGFPRFRAPVYLPPKI
jgi:hypothetical protein